MRTILSAVAASLMVLLTLNGASRAALDEAPAASATLELLVFEHEDCVYCRYFRRDIAPRYRRATPAGAVVPLRFVDIAKSDTASLHLKARIDTVPTVVLMKNGNEVDRIVGYWGPDNFFKLLAHILVKAE